VGNLEHCDESELENIKYDDSLLEQLRRFTLLSSSREQENAKIFLT
jgi:hypothetical protein